MKTFLSFQKIPLVFGLCLVLLISTRTTGLAADGAVLWEADFSGLQPGPAPQFGASVEIREQDGAKTLCKQSNETEFLFGKSVLEAKPLTWGSYSFKVRYREQDQATFTFVIKIRAEPRDPEYLQYYVAIGEKGFALACHNLAKEAPGIAADDSRRKAMVSYEELGADPLMIGGWITAEVTVGDELIHVSVDAGDGIKRATDFKVFPGNGGVSVLTRSAVDIASAVVREADAPAPKNP